MKPILAGSDDIHDLLKTELACIARFKRAPGREARHLNGEDSGFKEGLVIVVEGAV